MKITTYNDHRSAPFPEPWSFNSCQVYSVEGADYVIQSAAAIAANHELGENAVRRDLSRLIAQATKTQKAPPTNLSEAKRLSTACQKKVTTKAKSATRSIIDRCRLLNVKVKTVTALVTNKWIAAIGGAIVTEGLLTACPRHSSSSELITAANIMPGKTLFQCSAVATI